MVAWGRVCCSMEIGKKLRTQNDCLLMKVVHRLSTTPWARWVNIYFSDRDVGDLELGRMSTLI